MLQKDWVKWWKTSHKKEIKYSYHPQRMPIIIQQETQCTNSCTGGIWPTCPWGVRPTQGRAGWGEEPGEDPLSWSWVWASAFPGSGASARKQKPPEGSANGPWAPAGQADSELCTLDTDQHLPFSVSQVHCIEKCVSLLLFGPLQQIQANWKTPVPVAKPSPTNHLEFRPKTTG